MNSYYCKNRTKDALLKLNWFYSIKEFLKFQKLELYFQVYEFRLVTTYQMLKIITLKDEEHCFIYNK